MGVEVRPSSGKNAAGRQGENRVILGKALGHPSAMFSCQAGGNHKEDHGPGQVQRFDASQSPQAREPHLMLVSKLMVHYAQPKPLRGHPALAAPHQCPPHARTAGDSSMGLTSLPGGRHMDQRWYPRDGGHSPDGHPHFPSSSPAISCSGFFYTLSFLRVPPLGLCRRSREPHTHSKIYSNESLMTLEGNRQAQKVLQRFLYKTKIFQAHPRKTNWGRRDPVHTEFTRNICIPCTCWGDGDGVAQGCWQSCRSRQLCWSSWPPLPSGLGPQDAG